ncbi:MAG: hypothetical protein J6S21_05200, partial [Victivallales bacterium]|nr:hypothetical protein [Victivallales bacterium]
SLTAAENGTLFSLSSPDVPLLLPDDREMWHYSPEAARPSGKFAFCISNNQWGTNFPQWCDDDFRCRFHFIWQRLN